MSMIASFSVVARNWFHESSDNNQVSLASYPVIRCDRSADFKLTPIPSFFCLYYSSLMSTQTVFVFRGPSVKVCCGPNDLTQPCIFFLCTSHQKLLNCLFTEVTDFLASQCYRICIEEMASFSSEKWTTLTQRKEHSAVTSAARTTGQP